MSATIIDGKQISNSIRQELKESIRQLKEKGIVPGLAVVLVGENPASQSYVRMKGKACEELGLFSIQHNCPATTSESELIELIDSLNGDPKIHGILVQLPLPKHINENAIINRICPYKDADGFHPANIGKVLIGEDSFRPCTPYGIQKLLAYAGYSTVGKHVVIVGRSNIVGKPIAAMLMQKGDDADATVTVCHSKTPNLSSITRQADILIAAIGKPEMITADMVSDKTVVIDVGINRVDDPGSSKGYKIVGDVKFDEVAKRCKAITPVPGGVGPMTITMLMYNTVKAALAKA